jgi:hypothetical protein
MKPRIIPFCALLLWQQAQELRAGTSLKLGVSRDQKEIEIEIVP